MVENHLLINEIQLGTELNECVHSQRRSDFSLMLAMLTDDAREFSEFLVPDAKAEEKLTLTVEQQLRKHFDLPKQAPLAIDELSDLKHFNQASLANTNNMATIHLTNAIQPKALAFRDNAKHIAADIVNNTNLHCQKRFQRSLEIGHTVHENLAVPKLNFNAKAWLKTVQQSIVATQLT